MNLSPIKNENDYEVAMKRVTELMDGNYAVGTEEFLELKSLALLVEYYETNYSRTQKKAEQLKLIYLSTHNDNKIREFSELFSPFVIVPAIGMPDVEEYGNSFRENAVIKAVAMYWWLLDNNKLDARYPIIADDSGLEVIALNRAPGIHSNRYWSPNKEFISYDYNNKALMDALKDIPKPWFAQYVSAITILYPTLLEGNFKIKTHQAICDGQITDNPRGDNGFAYDRYFEPACSYDKKTMAEFTNAEKNMYSHRAIAASAARIDLRNNIK